MHTLDHLAGVANRAAIHYTGESQLREVGRNHGSQDTLTFLYPRMLKLITIRTQDRFIIGQKRSKAKGAICKFGGFFYHKAEKITIISRIRGMSYSCMCKAFFYYVAKLQATHSYII